MSPALHLARPISRFLRWLPWKFAICVVIAASCIKENYPVSHFPMYDSFERSTFYLYVAGADGSPIALQTLTGTDITEIKMMMTYRFKGEKARQTKAAAEAKKKGEKLRVMKVDEFPLELKQRFGREILDWLVQHHPALPGKCGGALKLMWVDLFVKDDGKLERKVTELTEVRP